MQPLGTKKSDNLLRQKKSCILSGQKKSRNLWDTKIMQPLRTKMIPLSKGPITSKLVQKSPNCSKWHQICPNGSKQVRMGPNESKLFQTFPKGTKCVQMRQLGPNWINWVYMGPKQGFKIGVKIIMNSIGWSLNPGLLGLVFL